MSNLDEDMQKLQGDSPRPVNGTVVRSGFVEEHDRRDKRPVLIGRPLSDPVSPATHEEQKPSFDIFEPLRILQRRKICLFISVPVFIVLAAVGAVMMPVKYVATSRLQLATGQTGRLSVGDSATATADAIDAFSVMQTDVTLMQSDTLAMQVIKELDLPDTKEFAFKPLLRTAEVKRQMALPFDQSPLKRAAVLAKFKSNLRIDILPGSRLISVSYSSATPELSALIVNHVVADFVDYDFRAHYNATIKSTEFLSRQLVDLKSEVEASQQRAVELQKNSGIFEADQGSRSEGDQGSHTLMDSELEQLNKQVITTEADRVSKEAIYNLARSGNPDVIVDLLGSSSSSGSSQTAQTLVPLINHLRQEQADLNVQYAQAVSEYGSAYPSLIQMKQQMQALQSNIQTELGKVMEGTKAEYELAVSQETAAKKKLAEQQALAAQMNDRAVAYNIAKNEADSNRALYQSLLQKLKEAEVLAGLRSSGLEVVDPAAIPGSSTRPKLRVFLIMGLLGGIVSGVLAAFLFEATDHTVRTLQELENATQAPLLGAIPQHQLSPASETGRMLELYTAKDASCALLAPVDAPTREMEIVAEAFRWVRTSLVLHGRGGTPRTFLIASASEGEGKSFTSLNLAAVLTENGSSVLLVDADLRRGNLSKVLNRQSEKGLSDVLRGHVDRRVPYTYVDVLSGLTFMPSGGLLKSPVNLLGSPKMLTMMEEWRREFTYVVIDTPPLLPVVDALVISLHVDTVLLVARSGYTQRASLSRALRLLKNAGVRNVNVLANAVETNTGDYSQYYGQPEYVAK